MKHAYKKEKRSRLIFYFMLFVMTFAVITITTLIVYSTIQNKTKKINDKICFIKKFKIPPKNLPEEKINKQIWKEVNKWYYNNIERMADKYYSFENLDPIWLYYLEINDYCAADLYDFITKNENRINLTDKTIGKAWIIDVYRFLNNQLPEKIKGTNYTDLELTKAIEIDDIKSYTVGYGESVEFIAYKHLTTPELINTWNGLPLDNNILSPGKKIIIKKILWSDSSDDIKKTIFSGHEYFAASILGKDSYDEFPELLWANTCLYKNKFILTGQDHIYETCPQFGLERLKAQEFYIIFTDVHKQQFNKEDNLQIFCKKNKISAWMLKLWNKDLPKLISEGGEIKFYEILWETQKVKAGYFTNDINLVSNTGTGISHRFIPIGTKLTIKNLSNGNTLGVKVTKIGPFKFKETLQPKTIDANENRLEKYIAEIGLSKTVAQALKVKPNEIVNVQISLPSYM